MNALNALASLRRIPLLLATAAVVAGCSTQVSEGLRVVSQQNNKTLTEKFPASFINRGAGGDYQIVLLKDDRKKPASARPAKPGAPLSPLTLSDIRQVVHIHVFWQPMRGAKPDNPSATNAAIDWYLVRADGAQVTGIAHYEGAGFVTVEIDDNAAEVVVRSGALKPSRIEGDIIDPVGPITLSGRFDVLHRQSAVDDVLGQLDKLKAGGLNSDVDAVRLTQPAAAAANAR